MLVELCQVETADGVRLDGAWAPAPDPSAQAAGPARTALLIHGTGGHFYGRGVLARFADEAWAAGWNVLRVNTRGHDLVAHGTGSGPLARGGAAYERLGDCTHDLTAWLTWLARAGHGPVAVVGHSVGGLKALYAQAHQPHPAVVAVAAISPPRLAHSRLAAHPAAAEFRRDFERAQGLAAAGRAEELMWVQQPLPLLITAGGLLEKYGPAETYDYVRWISAAACPLLALFGGQTLATNPAFDGAAETLQSLALPHLSVQVVPDADMQYRSAPGAPFAIFSAWLAQGFRLA